MQECDEKGPFAKKCSSIGGVHDITEAQTESKEEKPRSAILKGTTERDIYVIETLS